MWTEPVANSNILPLVQLSPASVMEEEKFYLLPDATHMPGYEVATHLFAGTLLLLPYPRGEADLPLAFSA